MSKLTFNISLSPQLAGFVRSKVDEGSYASVSDVVREALRLLATSGRSPEASVPTLLDMQEQRVDRTRARSAIRALRRLRKGTTLGRRLTVKDLRDEGRR